MKRRYLFIGVAKLFAWTTLAANPHPEISRYHVKLIPDLNTKSIAGTTEIFLRRTFAQPQALHFPLNDLQVDQIKSGSTSVSYSTDKGILSFEVPPNNQSVEIRYRGTPTKGLNFGPSSVYSSYFTCNWMICREDPGEKALFSIELTLPKDLKVVASGEEVGTTALPGGQTLHSWMQQRPYSTYLFGFAVGRFNETKSKIGSTELLVLSEVYESPKLAKLFQDTGRMVQFFENKSGLPFPHKKYAQILVENSEAQENSSFSVLGKEEIDPLLSDPKEDWVIAHELSHQWWGNLITCRTWQHVWLNEGMTVFMVAAYKEMRWGKVAYEKELEIAKKRWDRAIEANFDVPLAYSKEYPSLRIMRAIVYSKAAIFFDRLRRTMGERNFWRGIRRYTKKFSGNSVESRDFESVMQKMTDKNLAPLFKKMGL